MAVEVPKMPHSSAGLRPNRSDTQPHGIELCVVLESVRGRCMAAAMTPYWSGLRERVSRAYVRDGLRGSEARRQQADVEAHAVLVDAEALDLPPISTIDSWISLSLDHSRLVP